VRATGSSANSSSSPKARPGTRADATERDAPNEGGQAGSDREPGSTAASSDAGGAKGTTGTAEAKPGSGPTRQGPRPRPERPKTVETNRKKP
jgi:hypothetical protein